MLLSASEISIYLRWCSQSFVVSQETKEIIVQIYRRNVQKTSILLRNRSL